MGPRHPIAHHGRLNRRGRKLAKMAARGWRRRLEERGAVGMLDRMALSILEAMGKVRCAGRR